MLKNKSIVLSNKCSCGPCLTLLRNICVHPVLESNHYKALGLNPSATHAEIKSAYYELSKKHHPDKNQGSEKSAKLFRDITEAYEILGNEKARRQYDREQQLNRRFETPYAQTQSYKPDYNDEFERMYYERRKRIKKYYYGKTPYYDFDAWYRAHYIIPNKMYRMRFTYETPKSNFRYDYSSKEKEEKIRKFKIKLSVILYCVTMMTLLMYGPDAIRGRKV